MTVLADLWAMLKDSREWKSMAEAAANAAAETVAPAPQPDQPAVTTAVDPVCGMTVAVGPDTPHLHADGREFWFCCPGCRTKFAAERSGA